MLTEHWEPICRHFLAVSAHYSAALHIKLEILLHILETSMLKAEAVQHGWLGV